MQSDGVEGNARIACQTIIEATGVVCEVAQGLITGHRRCEETVRIRYACIAAISRLRPDLSLSRVARNMNRDHTTILHALRRVTYLLQDDPRFGDLVKAICDEAEGRTSRSAERLEMQRRTIVQVRKRHVRFIVQPAVSHDDDPSEVKEMRAAIQRGTERMAKLMAREMGGGHAG